MTYQITMEKSGIVMLIEDSKLRELVESKLLVNMYTNDSDIIEKSKKEREQIMSLLDKCIALNDRSQKWKEAPKAHNAEDAQDWLKHYIAKTMKRIETRVPKNWAGLVKELRYEMKVAYDKFINLRKKYFKLIETNNGNEGSELIKAYIARDIQDYVKYGINICLQCVWYSSSQQEQGVEKIAIHFEMLARELEGINVRNEDDVRRLAEDVSLYKQCMLDLADQYEVNSPWSSKKFNSNAYLKLCQKGEVLFSDPFEREKINQRVSRNELLASITANIKR